MDSKSFTTITTHLTLKWNIKTQPYSSNYNKTNLKRQLKRHSAIDIPSAWSWFQKKSLHEKQTLKLSINHQINSISYKSTIYDYNYTYIYTHLSKYYSSKSVILPVIQIFSTHKHSNNFFTFVTKSIAAINITRA